jgi:hypothetical protein
MGLKYQEYNPGSELNILQWTMKVESNKIIKWKKVEEKLNKDKWISEQQQNKSNNNNNTLYDWQMSIMHNINNLGVSLLK